MCKGLINALCRTQANTGFGDGGGIGSLGGSWAVDASGE